MIRKVHKDEFAQAIASGTVLVDFYGNTCIPCKMYAKELEQAVFDMPFLEIVKVCSDEDPEILSQYDVMAVPTTLIFHEGELVERFTGMKPADDVKELMSSYIYG